jgi:hypothetical protein
MLLFASVKMRADRGIVAAAIKTYGRAISYASCEIRSDRELALVAVKQNGDAYAFLDKSLRFDYEIASVAVATWSRVLVCCQCIDKAIVLAAVRLDGCSLEFAPESFKDDGEVVLAAVRQNGRALQFAAQSKRENLFVVLHAIANTRAARRYSSRNLTSSVVREFIARFEEEHAAFVSFLMVSRPMTFADHEEGAVRRRIKGEPVHQLNAHGPFFARILKTLIADFAGVPIGSYWEVILAAKKNVQKKPQS